MTRKSDPNEQQKKIKFAEKISLIFEGKGHPRIAGQIIGWLLVCNPPEQSFSDLVDNLQVSKASVSNMTRMLLQVGFIEKVRKQGERQIYFKLVDDAWRQVMENQLQFVYSLRDVGEKCLDSLQKKDDRIKEMYKFNNFMSKKLPELIQDYKQGNSNS